MSSRCSPFSSTLPLGYAFLCPTSSRKPTSLNLPPVKKVHSVFGHSLIFLGNSEVYVVGKGFRGIDPELLAKLSESVCTPVFTCNPNLPQVQAECPFRKNSLLPLDFIPDFWLEAFISASKFFAKSQRQVIEDNLVYDHIWIPHS